MEEARSLALAYQPNIQRDIKDPFPIRYIGYTVFRERGESQSFGNLVLDPAEAGAACIVEYAVFYDYDIQHLYDLEHIWVAADRNGAVTGCWGSFHGMRLRISHMPTFRVEGTHPVVYAQPGKHAFLSDPELFWLHQDYPESCGPKCGGGLLVPEMLADAMHTDEAQDRMIDRHIREKYAFYPAMEYELEPVEPERLIPWPELKERIPRMVEAELARIRAQR